MERWWRSGWPLPRGGPCDRYIGDHKLTPPPIGDNALDLLQAVQQRAPNYSGTTQRTLSLVAALKAEAQTRKERGEFIDAEAALGFASSLAPEDAGIATLRAGIAEARTRSEQAAKVRELLVKADLLKKTYVLRRILNPMGTIDAIEFLLDKLRQTKSNSDFFDSMNA